MVCSRHLSASELQGDTKRQEKPRGFSATPFSATASATVLGPMVPSSWFGGKPGKDPASLGVDLPPLGTCRLNWEELRLGTTVMLWAVGRGQEVAGWGL